MAQHRRQLETTASSSAFERTLASVARQEAEHDFRRRRLFIEESRNGAAIHADKLSGESAMYPVAGPPAVEPAHRVANHAAWEAALVHGDRSGSHWARWGKFANRGRRTEDSRTVDSRHDAICGTPSFGSAVHERFDHYRSSQSSRAKLDLGTSSDRVRHEVQREDAPARDPANDPITQVAFPRHGTGGAARESRASTGAWEMQRDCRSRSPAV